MIEDASLAQARMMITVLRGEITEISDELQTTEKHLRRQAPERGPSYRVKRITFLRQQLFEAHRLIEGLYRRFPESGDRPQARPPRRA
jgi:hypothetical protein